MKFKIGDSPGIVFRFPSKKPGDGSVLVGNVNVDIYRLKCSEPIELRLDTVGEFCNSIKRLHSDLVGECGIKSEKGNFSVNLSVTSTGFILVQCNISKYEFDGRYDCRWSAEGSFQFVPDDLLTTIKEISAQS